jgi:hypothetical protein
MTKLFVIDKFITWVVDACNGKSCTQLEVHFQSVCMPTSHVNRNTGKGGGVIINGAEYPSTNGEFKKIDGQDSWDIKFYPYVYNQTSLLKEVTEYLNDYDFPSMMSALQRALDETSDKRISKTLVSVLKMMKKVQQKQQKVRSGLIHMKGML